MSIFAKGVKANYIALPTKDPNTVYFCTDVREMYVGAELYTEPVRFYVGALPTNAAQGVLYINETTGLGSTYNGTAWVTVIKPVSVVINPTASDDTVPSTKAVKDYIDGLIDDVTGGEGIVKNVSLKENETGIIVVTAGDGLETDLELTGTAHDISYNSTTLVLTIPMVGKPDLVINLPEDNFIKSGEYNTTTKNIEIALKDGNIIYIPAEDLIDVYTSGSGVSDTIAITVDSDNKISASFNVDTSGALDIAADGKLTIDLSTYATIEYIDGILEGLNERIIDIEESLSWSTF